MLSNHNYFPDQLYRDCDFLIDYSKDKDPDPIEIEVTIEESPRHGNFLNPKYIGVNRIEDVSGLEQLTKVVYAGNESIIDKLNYICDRTIEISKKNLSNPNSKFKSESKELKDKLRQSINGLNKIKAYSKDRNTKNKIQDCINRFNETAALLEKIQSRGVKQPAAKGKQLEKAPLDETKREAFIKRFALIFGDTFIKNTAFEGGDIRDSIEYWMDMVESWERGEGYLPGISRKVIQDLKADFQDVKFSNNCLQKGDPDSIHNLYNALKAGLENRGRFVLPLNHTGKEGTHGHVFVCVFEKTPEGKIICEILNKGEGSGLHPVVSKDDYATKHSYRFYPIVIDDPEFLDTHQEATEALLKRLSLYASAKNQPKGNETAYKSEEIYRLMALFAGADAKKLVEDYNALKMAEKTREKGENLDVEMDVTDVTGQRSGTCSEQAARLIIRDNLLMRNHQDKKAYKQCIFSGKLEGLKRASQYLDMNDEENRILMQNALQEFAIYTDRLIKEKILPVSKANDAQMIIREIREKIKSAKKILPERTFPDLDPPLSSDTVKIAYTIPDSANIKKANEVKKKPESTPLQVPSIQLPPPEKLKDTLTAWLSFIKKTPDKGAAFLTSYNALMAYPIPGTEEGDAYWSQISEKEAGECLLLLNQWVNNSQNNVVSFSQLNGESFPYFYVMNQSAYAIMDCLARKKPELCLEGFAYHFNQIEPASLIYHGPLETKKLKQVKDYFALNKKQNPNELFNFNTFAKSRPFSKKIYSKTEHIADYEWYKEIIDKTEYMNSLYFNRIKDHLDEKTKEELKDKSPAECYAILSRFSINQFEGIPFKGPLPEEYYALFEASLRNFATTSMDYTTPALGGSCTVSVNEKTSEVRTSYDFELNDLRSFSKNVPFFKSRISQINDEELVRILYDTNPSENDAMIAVQTKGAKFDSATYHQLRKLKLNPHTQIAATLQWCREHPSLLQDADIQSYIEFCFLKKGVLENTIHHAPHLQEEIQTFMQGFLKDSMKSPKTLNTALFLLRTSMHMDQRIAAIRGEEGKKYQTEQILHYADQLEQLMSLEGITAGQKKELLFHKVYFLGRIPHDHMSKEIYTDLIICWLSLPQNPDDPKSNIPFWLKGEAYSGFCALQEQIQNLLHKDSEILNDVFIRLGQKGIDVKGPWQGNYPTYQKGPHKVNLLNGLIFENEYRIGQLPQKFIYLLPDKVFPEGSNFQVKHSDTVAYAIDGSCEIHMSGLIKKKIPVGGGKEAMGTYIDPMVIKEYHIPEILIGKRPCWKIEEGGPFYLLIQNYNGKPYARWDFDPEKGAAVISRVDADGMPTNEKLIDIGKLDETSSLRTFLRGMENENRILLWGEETDIGIHPTALEFPDLNHLRFTFQRQGKETTVLSPQFPKMTPAKQQDLTEMHHLEGCLVLEHMDDPRKKQVLIPYDNLSERRDIFHPLKTLSHAHHPGQPYYIYDISNNTGRLSNSSPRAMLYLINIFKQQGRYEQAYDYLKDLHAVAFYEDEDLNILNEIVKTPHTHPTAIALNMQLALNLVENKSLLLFKNQKVQKTKEEENGLQSAFS